MEAFTDYMLRSVIWLTGFTLVYLIFLRDERYFNLKRIYLIAGIIFSLAFPFITIHYQVELEVPDRGMADPGLSVFSSDLSVQYSPGRSFDYRLMFLIIYLSGALIIAYMMIRNILPLLKAIRKSRVKTGGSVKLIRNGEYRSSFSFFNFVFINNTVENPEAEEILNHEAVHVKQKHWVDLLIAEIVKIIQWINPFVWVYTALIRHNHEYLADKEALRLSTDPANYKAALLNQLFSTQIICLSNSFNQSLCKKRFEMMKNISSSPFRKMKILIVLPVIALIFYAFAEPEYHYKKMQVSSVPGMQDPVKEQKNVKSAVTKFTRTNPEDYPTFQGEGPDAFREWVVKRVTYPPEALEEKLEGWIVVKFTVEADGSLSNVRYAGKASPVLGEEVVRVVRTSPKWEPAKNPAARVPYETSVTARFGLTDKFKRTEPQNDTERMPQYPGGEAEMLKFIAQNIIYPRDARAENIQGKVLVRFIINKEGEARNFRVVKSIYPSLDLEAVRVLGLLNDFTPGYRDGKPIDVEYIVPIKFVLRNKNGTSPVSRLMTSAATDSAVYDYQSVTSEEVVIIGYPDGVRNPGPLRIVTSDRSAADPLFIVDGEVISKVQMDRLDVSEIESVSVLKGEMAIEKYGKEAKNGVVVIKLKERLR